mmetsp:Transcript_20637/g.23356  ORF Transcript_20637/g.23356 Transcript_20637/m.23356 type:complete len:255 (-) Transcript_20637:71-835(-)
MAESNCNKGCCPIGSEPALASDYQAKGAESILGDLPIYTIGEGKSAVIVSYDVYGFNGGRVRLICDQLAEQGYYVILPDFYRGDAWDPETAITMELTTFVQKFAWEKLKVDFDEKLLPHLAEKGIEKVGLVGFCWGAWLNFHAMHNEKFTCGANLHPSIRLENCFGSNEVELAKGVKCPQLVFAASNDPDNVKGDGEVLQVLKAAPFGDKCVFQEFPEVNHGFVTRGDVSTPEVARDVKIAMEGVVAFFKTHLG